MAESKGPLQEFQGIGESNESDPHTCCYDAKLSEELISKCKEKPQQLKNLSLHLNHIHNI